MKALVAKDTLLSLKHSMGHGTFQLHVVTLSKITDNEQNMSTFISQWSGDDHDI